LPSCHNGSIDAPYALEQRQQAQESTIAVVESLRGWRLSSFTVTRALIIDDIGQGATRSNVPHPQPSLMLLLVIVFVVVVVRS